MKRAAALRAVSAAACAVALTACATPAAPWAPALIDVVRPSYPELRGAVIDVGAVRTPRAAGQALPNLPSLFGGGPRRYELRIGELAARPDCPLAARRAVVAHELAHIAAMQRRDASGVLSYVGDALVDAAALERRTDVEVVARGFGGDMVTLRTWARRVPRGPLDPKAADVARVYYGVDELVALDDVRVRCPAVFARFLAAPPRSLREILDALSLNAFRGCERGRSPRGEACRRRRARSRRGSARRRR